MTARDILRVDGVSHAFGAARVLRDLSFSLRAGEFASLLGPSGCGKTTLLRLIAGLEPLQAGRIAIDGRVVADAAAGSGLPPEARRVGMVFQDFALFPHLTVRQNIMFGVRQEKQERRQWMEEMLARFGLAGRGDAHPPTLSGGEQQRVALLRALAPRPALVLLDEPFASLDAARRLDMREDTLELIREAGAAALMVTHDAAEAMFMSDRILVMGGGRILQQGTPEEIYDHPASGEIMGLFGHINRFEGVVNDAGEVVTPLGGIAAPAGMRPGDAAVVFVRSSAFEPVERRARKQDGACCLQGRVTAAFFMGQSSHLHIMPDETEEVVHVQVRGRFMPRRGEVRAFMVKPDGVFVFPAAVDS